MSRRYSEINFTEKEMSILSMVFQNMRVPPPVDWDAAALALGYANAGSLRSYWNQILRAKIVPAAPGAGSGVRRRKGAAVEDGHGIDDAAVESKDKTRKKKLKIASRVLNDRASGNQGDNEAWFDGPTSATDGVDRPIKIEEEAASALAPIVSFNDDFAADATKSKKTKATNVAASALIVTKSSKGHNAAMSRARKSKIDEDAAYVPAQANLGVAGGDAHAGDVNEKDPIVGTTSAPVAPMGGAAELSPAAADDRKSIIAGGTMTPRKRKRDQVEEEEPKKRKAASKKSKAAFLRLDDPEWTKYLVREPKAAAGKREDGSSVAAKKQRSQIDGHRKAGSLAEAGGRKRTDGENKHRVQPANAARKTIKPEPEIAMSIETGNSGFDAGIATSFGSFESGGAVAVMAPTYNGGYYGSVPVERQTDGSFSASTNPDNGSFSQEALESFAPAPSYPANENGVRALLPTDYPSSYHASDEYGGFAAPQYGGHPQYIGYPGWSHPGYGPVDYQYPAASFGFGPLG